MNTMELYIQHAFNVDTHKIEYAELLVRKYKNIDNVGDILKYVQKHKEFIEFDLNVLGMAIKYVTDNKVEYKVAVNISPDTLGFKSATHKIIEMLNNCSCKDNIVLEITEETNFDDLDVIENLHLLTEAGISLALDDFGVNNSNLRELINLDTDYIKIDKSFIDNISDTDKDKKARNLVVLSAIRDVAEKLNTSIIVECVETMEQLEEIKKLRLKCIQGFLFERPRPLYNS